MPSPQLAAEFRSASVRVIRKHGGGPTRYEGFLPSPPGLSVISGSHSTADIPPLLRDTATAGDARTCAPTQPLIDDSGRASPCTFTSCQPFIHSAVVAVGAADDKPWTNDWQVGNRQIFSRNIYSSS